MTKIERVAFVAIGVLAILAFVFWKDVRSIAGGKTNNASITGEKIEKKKKDKEVNTKTSTAVTIEKKWEMPAVLNEVSGIATISEKELACVQDEIGTIFIFNIENGSIEKEI